MWIEYGWRDILTLEGLSLHSILVYFLYFLNKNFLNLNLKNSLYKNDNITQFTAAQVVPLIN